MPDLIQHATDTTEETTDNNKTPERRIPGSSIVESVRVYQKMPGYNSPPPQEGDAISSGSVDASDGSTLPEDRWSKHRFKYKPERLDAVRQMQHDLRNISWKHTRQGHDYWEQVFHDLEEMERFLIARRDGQI